jgi:hypothetical protein
MKTSAAVLVVSLIGITPALVMGTPTTIAQWTFESSVPTTSGSYSPEVGSGSASGLHAGTTTYSSPAGNGSSHSFSANNWAVADYFQFQLRTVGYQNIGVSWDQTSSSTGPGAFGLFYSTDGSTFTQFGANYSVLVNGSPNSAWSSSGSPNLAFHFAYDLSSITALNNAAAVYFRLVDESTLSASGGAVASGGADRVDNFTVVSVPDSLTGLGGLACALGLVEVLRRMHIISIPLTRRHA